MDNYLEPFPLPAMIREDQPLVESNRGRFVVFDGIDGTGKTTLVDITKRFLSSLGLTVQGTKQPGGSAYGDKVRELLFVEPGSAGIEATALELLFMSNHLHNCREVEEALSKGDWVVADRWSHSALPYAAARGDARSDVRELYRKLVPLVRWDVFFLMLDDPFKAVARANARTTESHQTKKKWNDPNVQAKVQNEFLRMFGPDLRTEKVWFEDGSAIQMFERRIAPRLRITYGYDTMINRLQEFDEALDLFVSREYQKMSVDAVNSSCPALLRPRS